MLLFRGSAVYFLYNFLQEADGTDCSNGELETFLATGYPVSRGWAVQSSLYVMSKKYGTDYPDKVDLITEKDGICYLYVVQSDELDGERTLALQEKLNNYLSFILDGQFEKEYPERAVLRKVVRIELQHKPAGIAAEFLRKVKPVFEAEGIGLECAVCGVSNDV